MEKNKWWGYIHINGNPQVKRYFDPSDIKEANESPFVTKVIQPFEATNRDEALEYVKTFI